MHYFFTYFITFTVVFQASGSLAVAAFVVSTVSFHVFAFTYKKQGGNV